MHEINLLDLRLSLRIYHYLYAYFGTNIINLVKIAFCFSFYDGEGILKGSRDLFCSSVRFSPFFFSLALSKISKISVEPDYS